jgi:integrase/recombinase XerD
MISSLLDTKEIWIEDATKAFDSFLLTDEFQNLGLRRPGKTSPDQVTPSPKPLRHSSVKVYQSMFGKYLRWLDANKKLLLEVTSSDLMDFLEREHTIDGKKVKVLNSRIQHKYLRLLERVYIHLDIRPNPARHASFDIFKSSDKNKVGRDAGMANLTVNQQSAFLASLPEIPPSIFPDDFAVGWIERRDRAMLAIMLGAGLKVSEVVNIRLDALGQKESTGSIPIFISESPTRTVREHETQLRPFATSYVLDWIKCREGLKITTPILFPATLQGGHIDKATVYRKVKANFIRAEINVTRMGGRTLRNTFAKRELKAGEPLELVGKFLGHRKRRSTEYYLLDGVTPAEV